MAEDKLSSRINSVLLSGRADETLAYSKHIKDYDTGKSVKQDLDERVKKTDQLVTNQLADSSVTTPKIADKSITTDKLDEKSVSTTKLQDSSVSTEKLNDHAVTTDKVSDKSITNPKLADKSVDGRVIKPESVDSPHLANKSVNTEKIENKSITHEKMAENSVDTEQLKNGSVDNNKLSKSSVSTEKIQDQAITNEKIADGTMKIGKLDPELRKSIQAATGLPENLVQMIQDVDESINALHDTDDNLQSQLDNHLEQITSNDTDIATIQERSTQMEQSIKDIAVSGGASVASAVSYDNEASGMTSITAQGAIDELSSNKFDKENIAQELGDSEDKVVSQYALPFRIEESEEWAYLIKDAEGHVLFGIQQDGSVEWQVGIPTPIRKRFEEVVSSASDNKSDLSTKIDEINTSLSTEIQSLQDTKVDKEEGKSLIDDEVKDCFKIVENDEFIHCIQDAEEHILFAIRRDTGKPYFPLNEMYHVEQNEEFLALWKDSADHILMGIRRDGVIIGEINACNILKKVIANIQSDVAELQSIEPSLKELLNTFTFQENEEFLAVETDSEGKILSATNADGSHYIHNAKSETIPEEFSHIEDPEERMEITTDADNRILSYRDKDGIKHEHEEEVETLHVSNLDLKDNSVDDIKSALIANGFNVKTPIDCSDSSFIQIPEPRFAIINITNIDSMPTSKTQNKQAYLEFWDMQGNYFKKHAILNAQGNSSMGFVKKNVAIDLCDDEWLGDETPKLRIGEWVPQDSFHMKAYYTDFFRGVGVVCYKLYDQIVCTRGNMYDRPWKKALLDMSKIGVTTKSFGNPYIGDYSLLTDTRARCFPDGFPVACYLNGTFYGIFSWQLKKHRDNYHMDKSIAEHIHLDGTLDSSTIFNGKDNIDWSNFEIRNPKGLYAIGGNQYNADIKQEEIAGEAEVNSWITAGKLPNKTDISDKIKNSLEMTVKVKKYIQGFADAISVIEDAASVYEKSGKKDEDFQLFKETFETFFDVDNLIDYQILSDLVNNIDGFRKNWQWFTYNGKKWFVGLYDCDISFGGTATGDRTYNTRTTHIGDDLYLPTGYIIKYFSTELNARYKQLSGLGIISKSNIFGLLKEWTSRIGTDFYKAEFKKWKDSPCIGDSVVREDYWMLMTDENGEPITVSNETFDAKVEYHIGDEVSFGIDSNMGFYKFKCVKDTTALDKNTKHTISQFSPFKEFKHCDNLYRIEKWIEQNLINMNSLYKI